MSVSGDGSERAAPSLGLDADVPGSIMDPTSPTQTEPTSARMKGLPINGEAKPPESPKKRTQSEDSTQSPGKDFAVFDEAREKSAMSTVVEHLAEGEGGLLSQLNETMDATSVPLRKQRTVQVASTMRYWCSCCGKKSVVDDLEKIHDHATRASTVNPALVGMAHIEDGEEIYDPTIPVAWIDSGQASLIFGAAILLNCIVMALETDWSRDDVQDGRFKPLFLVLEVAFIVIFTGEIAVRFRTHLLSFFCDAWNIFDVVVVGIGVVSIGMEIVFDQQPAAFSFTSSLRALRLLRLARIVKLVRLFRELYLLVNGITSAMRALFWVAVMTILVILVCSIFITRTIGQRDMVRMYAYEGECRDVPEYYTRPRRAGYDPYYDPVESPKLACSTLDYFGTVPQSMFSLFCVMTLEGWPDMARTLIRPESGGFFSTIFFFIFFVFFTNIFLLNLVTGVIVENVLIIAHEDEIEQVRAEKLARENQTKKLNELFILADTDGSQSVSREEFHDMLLNPDVITVLRSLEIHIWDAEDLFDILDVDDSGSMDIKEFFEGFSRVKGSAHGKHLLKLHYDLLRENSAFRELVLKTNTELEQGMQHMSSTATEKMVSMEQVLHSELAPLIPSWKPGGSDGTSRQQKGELAFDEAAMKPPDKPTRLPPSATLTSGVPPAFLSENGNPPMAPFFEYQTGVDAEQLTEVYRTLNELASTWKKIEEGFDFEVRKKSKDSYMSGGSLKSS
jgi:voltage-gated sodium channel